jgi:hypothetical protein
MATINRIWTSLNTEYRIYLFLILCGVITGLVLYRRLNRQLKFVCLLLCMTFISEIISRVLAIKIRNSNPEYHFYGVAECILLMGVLYHITPKDSRKKIISGVFIGLAVFSIVNSIFFQGLYEYNSNLDLVKIPLTVIIAILLIFDKLNLDEKEKYLLTPDLLVLIAILWFNLFSFIYNASHNYLVANKKRYDWLDDLHYYSNLFYYSLLLVSFLVFIKTRPDANERRFI